MCREHMKVTVGCVWLKVRKVQITIFLLDELSLRREANFVFQGETTRK
jgi:hypothetical protein